MPLTPDEEQQLRDEIRANLEKRLARDQRIDDTKDSRRQEKLEERLRRQVQEEEEEKFYSERGYVRYVNHRGGVEWLTPEEAEHRHGKRRTKKGSSRRKSRQRKKILQWVINLGAGALTLAVFLYLWRYNPIQEKNTGTIVIQSNVPGAQVFLNGAEKRNLSTPDTLFNLNKGAYFVSVFKDGYSSWPPMQRISVEKGKSAVADFELKSAGLLGQIAIDANVADVKIYLNGIRFPAAAGTSLLEVPAGYHVVTLVKEGYIAYPSYRRILVNESETANVRFELRKTADIGYLNIISNRSSAYVYLSDRFSGIKANGEAFPVEPGVYQVHLQENGYTALPVSELVRITPGKTLSLTFTLLPAVPSDTLQVLTEHPGANIILNGELLPYLTPLPDLAIARGMHFLNFMREGRMFAEKDLMIEIPSLKEKVISVKF